MSFSILPPEHTERAGYVRIDLRVLHEMLRLPSNVKITGIREDDTGWIIDLLGIVPASGELVANYKMIHTTIPMFEGFEPAP
jgi:hypothetical protein